MLSFKSFTRRKYLFPLLASHIPPACSSTSLTSYVFQLAVFLQNSHLKLVEHGVEGHPARKANSLHPLSKLQRHVTNRKNFTSCLHLSNVVGKQAGLELRPQSAVRIQCAVEYGVIFLLYGEHLGASCVKPWIHTRDAPQSKEDSLFSPLRCNAIGISAS